MSRPDENVTNRRALSLEQIEEETSLSKAFWRKEIQAGRLRAKLVGRRVVVLSETLDEYLQNRPDWAPQSDRSAASVTA